LVSCEHWLTTVITNPHLTQLLHHHPNFLIVNFAIATFVIAIAFDIATEESVATIEGLGSFVHLGPTLTLGIHHFASSSSVASSWKCFLGFRVLLQEAPRLFDPAGIKASSYSHCSYCPKNTSDIANPSYSRYLLQ
jgi:hypothetical protein